jgi:hypothetical protein
MGNYKYRESSQAHAREFVARFKGYKCETFSF